MRKAGLVQDSPEKLERTVEPAWTPGPKLPDDLEALVESSSEEELRDFLRLLHPADVADLLYEVDQEDHWPRIVSHLPDARLAQVLTETEGGVHEDLIDLLPPERLVRLVGMMDSDDAADLVGELPEATRSRIVGSLKRRDAQALRQLLQYGEDTAGGLMQTELARVRTDATITDAIGEIRRRARELGPSLHTVYVVDAQNRLVGQVPLHKLVLADEAAPVESVMEPPQYQVTPEVDQEDVAAVFSRYDLIVLPVVSDEGHLLGRILIDDIVDVLEEEADEDMMRMVGASEEDLVYSDRVLRISAYRLPWLVVNLFGGLVTGWLLWRFKATLGEVLALVTFVPVITAMGGNVGTQSVTILTRGFATGRVDEDNIRWVFLKEFLIGLTMGTACGLVVAAAAMIWHGDPVLGMVVGVSMVSAMTVAATIGTLAPATFKRLKIDPAIAAGPFVTTANDITGILIYFGTATLFLRFLHG